MSAGTREDCNSFEYLFSTPADAAELLDLIVNTFLKMEPLNVSIDKHGLRKALEIEFEFSSLNFFLLGIIIHFI